MKQFAGFEEAKVNKGSNFEALPKGAYVLKVVGIKKAENKNGGSRFDIAFDIAEGEHKDFYTKQYQESKKANEDAKLSNDAIYRLNIPEDTSPDWMKNNFKTFVVALEESNGGYHWDWDEKKWKGKLFGGLFRIEQDEYNGKIYSHTRLTWVRGAEDIRTGKYGKLPNDKLKEASDNAASNGGSDWVNVSGDIDEELPFN